ncbi:sigma-70 family RNA polymerase sigma factor [Verrucomicrobium spinosum]|uniref:sigma-70 family RNA polymerase sigma factor n=1 Tax=Verrucomicrobium spinosum TaxID=2736 RepID=UPI0001744716|nr:sigma-70 family RNA polymerase sigma factor [Verrucomicrobium spinosum]
MESADRTTEFLTLLTQHDRALGVYVYSLVPLAADADDILQQTKMVMWRSFSQFELGTNFLAWARKVAFHQILTYRREKKKEHLPLEDDVLEAIGHEVEKLATDGGDHRRDALQACLLKLPKEHRQLILLRYYEDLEVDQVASRIQSTPGAVYRALSRVRMALLDCVERQMQLQPNANEGVAP